MTFHLLGPLTREVSLHVDAPPVEVWALVSDVTRIGEWSPCQVTKCVPNEVFEFAVGTDDLTLTNWGYRLEPDGTGTKVTEYFRLEPKLMMRLYWTVLGPLRGRTNERGMRTTLTRMKKVLES
jgi:hypothetical protein